MARFILDENLSFQTAGFLKALSHDVKTLADFNLNGATDDEVVSLVFAEKRILVTLDSDFGEIYYFATDKKFSVVIFKTKNQTPQSINLILENLLKTKILEQTEFKNSLLIVSEDKIRIRRK